jgi:hypothetical protein
MLQKKSKVNNALKLRCKQEQSRNLGTKCIFNKVVRLKQTDSISLQDNKVLLELHDVIASKFGAYVGKKT